VHVYGPFGRFTQHRLQRYERMIWVGSGIGITPFLGMLSFERGTLDLRRIWLYYVVRKREDAVYDREIRAIDSHAGFAVEYTLWITSENDHLTARRIAADVKCDNYAVMLCGSMPFVADFRSQFHTLGVPLRRIVAEELQFRGAAAPPRRARAASTRA
jgi:predicted ferric reductase